MFATTESFKGSDGTFDPTVSAVVTGTPDWWADPTTPVGYYGSVPSQHARRYLREIREARAEVRHSLDGIAAYWGRFDARNMTYARGCWASPVKVTPRFHGRCPLI